MIHIVYCGNIITRFISEGNCCITYLCVKVIVGMLQGFISVWMDNRLFYTVPYMHDAYVIIMRAENTSYNTIMVCIEPVFIKGCTCLLITSQKLF